MRPNAFFMELSAYMTSEDPSGLEREGEREREEGGGGGGGGRWEKREGKRVDKSTR